MFFRLKPAGKYKYLQIVETHREGNKVKQTVIATIGRLDKLAPSGTIDKLVASAARFGETLGDDEAGDRFERRTKDWIEETLFHRRRDLFSDLDLVFFGTTSLYFTGEGGESLGQYGKSKDRRSDCKQMVSGMVLDGDGLPVCSEMWPGNTADVTAGPGGGTPAEALRGPLGVPCGRRRDDLQGHDRGGRGAGLAVHPRCPPASDEGDPRHGSR